MRLMTISAVVLGLAMSGGAFADDGQQRERGQRGWGAGLDLTAEQREQLQTIRTNYGQQFRQLHAEMQDQINAVLTPEQQAKAQERREAMRDRMRQRMEQRGERRQGGHQHRRGPRS